MSFSTRPLCLSLLVITITGCSSTAFSGVLSSTDLSTTAKTPVSRISLADAQRQIAEDPKSISRIMLSPLIGGHFYTPKSLGNGRFITKDGEIVTLPENEEALNSAIATPSPSPTGTTPPCTSQSWSGNTPPTCATTGAFRRVYSGPGNNTLYSDVTLPSKISTMSANASTDTGYVYVEGWPGANAANSEAGLIYSPLHNWYTMYISPLPSKPMFSAENFQAGHELDFAITTLDNEPGYEDCSTNTCLEAGIFDLSGSCGTSGSPAAGYTCSDGDETNAAGWVRNCCIFARMTTIAQTNGHNNFTNGSEFGPIEWSASEVGPYNTSGSLPTWNSGGTQSWPNDSIKIIVDYTNLANETDTIYLHP